MPKFCAIVGCHNKSGRDSSFSFFKLPKAVKLRDLWIAAINRTDSSQARHWYVCSAHFQTGRPVLNDTTHVDHLPHLNMASGRKRSRPRKCLKLQLPVIPSPSSPISPEKVHGSVCEEKLLKWCNDQIALGANLGVQISDETLQAQAGLIRRTLNPSEDSFLTPDAKWVADFRRKHAEVLANNTAILQLVVTPPGIPPQLVNLPVLITEPPSSTPQVEFKQEVKEEAGESRIPTGEEALSAVEAIKLFLSQDNLLLDSPETNSALTLVEELVQEKYFEMKNKNKAEILK